MKSIKKWTYGLIVLCMAIAVVLLQYSYDSFHIMRMFLMGMLVSIPLVFGSKHFQEYGRTVLLGIVLYFISAHVTTRNGGDSETRMFFSCIIYIVFARAFMSFKGFTFKTRILLILSCIAIVFFMILGTEMKNELYLTIVMAILFISMVWQGINLFVMRSSRGYFFIFLFSVLYIIINILGGFNQYLASSFLMEVSMQVLHWISLLILVHSTTLDRKEFNKLL